MKRAAALTVLVVTLAGCATPLERHMEAVETKPPTYKAGYLDGCKTALAAGGDDRTRYTKDTGRYDREALYHEGWHDALRRCGR